MTAEAAVRPHPAPFSPEILGVAAGMLGPGPGLALDPMAGVGRGLDLLAEAGYTPIGWEIEPEWAISDPRTRIGDFRANDLANEAVDVIFTSPSYGNRLADGYAGSPKDMESLAATGKIRRRTYRIALGRPLSDGSGAGLQWGPEYRDLHWEIMREMDRVLVRGGMLVLNISDHIRDGEVQPVSGWWIETLVDRLDMVMDRFVTVRTRRYRDGANRTVRVPFEHVIRFRRS